MSNWPFGTELRADADHMHYERPIHGNGRGENHVSWFSSSNKQNELQTVNIVSDVDEEDTSAL